MTRREAREQAFILIFEKSFNSEAGIDEILDLAKELELIDDDEFLETVIVKRSEMAEIVGQEDYGLMMRLAWEMFEKKN